MRSLAHILNLVVRKGLKNIDASITRICAIARYVRWSPIRLQNFKTCVEGEKIESFILDVQHTS